jgi:predicted DNA-binding transcriptional regulator AlpA
MQNNTLPESAAFVRLPTILKILPISRSTWLTGIKSGHFPKPVRLGKRIAAWRIEDIRNLINSNENGGNHGTSN